MRPGYFPPLLPPGHKKGKKSAPRGEKRFDKRGSFLYNISRTIMQVWGSPPGGIALRLDLRDIIHIPDAQKPFQLQLDLSGLEFYGRRPITRPVLAEGRVTNHAGALVLEGTARSVLDLVCDRCGKPFSREKTARLDCLLAQELEDEENDEIVLLEDGGLDLTQLVTEAFVLAMDTKNLCSDDCKGLCPKCGADLNQGPCSCKAEPDPRWAALSQLLNDAE